MWYDSIDPEYVISNINIAKLYNKDTVVLDLYNVPRQHYMDFIKFLRDRNVKTETLLVDLCSSYEENGKTLKEIYLNVVVRFTRP